MAPDRAWPSSRSCCFGAKRLPELGKGLGEGLKGFKEGIKGITDPGTPTPTAQNTPPRRRRATPNEQY